MIARNRGFGLVEIMVGLMVGLISMVVVMQVYSVFENQKRATTSGSDAQTNGALALYLMEREVRAAGNGMTEGEPLKFPPLAGCTTKVYDATGAYLVPNKLSPFVSAVAEAGSVADIRLAPAIASDGGGGGASDALTIAYGTSSITAPYTLSADYAAGSTPVGLYSMAGISQNDMVALIQTNAGSGSNITPGTCSLLQATAAPACPTCMGGAGTCPATGAGTCVSTCPVAGTCFCGGCNVPVTSGTRYNKGGGAVAGTFFSAVTTPGYAHLNNLGQLNVVTYRISGNNLVADISRFGYDPVAAANVSNRTDFSPLASNIVNMQVQYGVDTGNPMGTIQANCKTNPVPGIPAMAATDADAVVDAWVDATGQWVNNGTTLPALSDLRRIRAVRIGLVARSGVKEAGTACATTTTAPVIHWDSGPNMTPDLSADADWQCYRYKVFQTTIPVRNALWSSTMSPASSASCGARDLS